MIFAQDNNNDNNDKGYIFTSSSICMMSTSVGMKVLCIINIGCISSKKIGVEKLL